MPDEILTTNLVFKSDGSIEITDRMVIEKIEAIIEASKHHELKMFYLTQGAPQRPVDLLCTCRAK